MTRDDIRVKITDIVEDILDKKPISPDANLKDEFGLDSLDAIEIAMDVGEIYGIEIEDNELAKVRCINDLVNFVEQKIDAK